MMIPKLVLMTICLVVFFIFGIFCLLNIFYKWFNHDNLYIALCAMLLLQAIIMKFYPD